MSDLGDYIEYDKSYELNIGKTFQNGSKVSYHHFKYDFTPASIDKNQEAKVNIGAKNDVLIQVPHVDGSAQKYTQFTGNKQPSSTKECILIYDTRTNEFTLERLQSNFILKRSRIEGSSKAQMLNTPRSITPTNDNASKKKKPEPNQPSESAKKSTTPSDLIAKSKDVPNNKNPSPQQKQSTLFQEKLFGQDLNLSDEDTESDSS